MNNFERNATLATIGIAGGGLLLTAAQFMGQPSDSESMTAQKVTVEVVGAASSEVNSTPKLAKIIKGETLGRQIEYIESIIGPPMNIFRFGKESQRTYDVDNCKVEIITDEKNAVSSFALDVSKACKFHWNDINYQFRGLPDPANMTFGDFFRDGSIGFEQAIGCAGQGCGNAAEPELTVQGQGGDVDRQFFVEVSTRIESRKESQAASAIHDKMSKKFGKEFAGVLHDICDKEVYDIVLSEISELRIDNVRFSNESYNRHLRGCGF